MKHVPDTPQKQSARIFFEFIFSIYLSAAYDVQFLSWALNLFYQPQNDPFIKLKENDISLGLYAIALDSDLRKYDVHGLRYKMWSYEKTIISYWYCTMNFFWAKNQLH